jgi:DHA2 family multidrug resistance protein
MSSSSASIAAPMPGVHRSEKATNKWFIAAAVALGALLEVIDTSIVNVAMTEIQNAFGATLTQVSWVVSSYAVANVIILPLTAWLGARFGKKNYFVFSLIGFTVASVLCGFATSLPMLILSRALQGLAGGGLLAKAQAILFETFPREEQAMAQGFFGAIVIAGPAIGPTLGGWLVTNVDWRWIFFVNIPVGIGAVFMCLAALPTDSEARDKSSVDWLAIALLATGLGSLQTVLEEGNTEDWFDSPMIVAFTAAAAFGLVTFVWRQLVSKNPVVDLRVLRYRSLWAGSLLSIVIGMALYGALFAIPIFAQGFLHYTSQQTGMLLLPGALASAVAMPIAAKVLQRVDARILLVGGGLVLITAIVMLGQLSTSTGADDLFWPLIIRSFGTVFMFLPLSMAALGPIPKKDVGKASGFYNLTRQLGGSVGVALLATLLSQRQAFHRAALVEKLADGSPEVLARIDAMASAFSSRGFSLEEAHAKGLAMLDGVVNQQAAIMSFADTFWATAVLIVATLPLVFLLGKASGKVTADAH